MAITNLRPPHVFQSTPPHGRRQAHRLADAGPIDVSIHASTWEATGAHPSPRPGCGSFNPRLHMGGDPLPPSAHLMRRVSIHASTWEATWLHARHSTPRIRFNPRLHMGGDSASRICSSSFSSFNPRLHMGGDAPMPGETGKQEACFNPRLHMGGDPFHPWLYHQARWFQSTPPHGRRPSPGRRRKIKIGFNPRLHMGGDNNSSPRSICFRKVSIHASTWEATLSTVWIAP